MKITSFPHKTDYSQPLSVCLKNMNQLTVSIETEPKAKDRRKIYESLYRYNAAQARDSQYKSLSVFLRSDQGEVMGGILGETLWGWLYVEFFWIEEGFRHQGHGSRLLKAAENEAVARGCTSVVLDTFSFQAYDFYKSFGYEEFGVLDDFPRGHKRFYMRKRLEKPNNL